LQLLHVQELVHGVIYKASTVKAPWMLLG